MGFGRVIIQKQKVPAFGFRWKPIFRYEYRRRAKADKDVDNAVKIISNGVATVTKFTLAKLINLQ